MRLIAELLEKNLSKEGLDGYLQRRVQGREDTKKTILLFWKQESPQLLSAVRNATSRCAS